VELVRDGSGCGWHRARWRDQWGNWQSGDCVPNEGGTVTIAGAQGGTIRIQISAVLPR